MALPHTTGSSVTGGIDHPPSVAVRGLLYELSLLLLAPFAVVVALFQAIVDPRVRHGHGYRFGLKLPPRPRRDVIWIHAVSVGEVNSVAGLVKLIREAGQYDVYLSTSTATGFATAQSRYGSGACLFYFPLDVPVIIHRFLRRIRPAAVLIAEVEIWPNFLRCARRLRTPVFLINGRIGRKEWAAYCRLRWFFKPFYSLYEAIFAQSEPDAQRMIEMGMPRERLRTFRNLKADLTFSLDATHADALRQLIPPNRVTIVAGSTHAPEERYLLSACRSIKASAFLVIAPRDIDRADEVRRLCREEGYDEDVLIVSTIGELPYLYQCADIVLMGGSFASGVGGHNFLEPLFFAKPVIVGPHMENFAEIERSISAAGGLCKVTGPEELAEVLRELMVDADRRREIGSKGYELLCAARGGSQETYDAMFDEDGRVRV